MLVNEIVSPRSVVLWISILIRSRNAFLGLVTIVAALKLVLSALAPASFEMRDIITLVGSGHAPIGPWIALYPPLYNQTATNLNHLEAWPLLAPGLSVGALSLLFRLPVFLFDLATLAVLFYVGRKMKSPVEGRLMGLVWFLNPYSLFGVELLGLPDVVCVFLVALSFLLVLSKRPFLCAAALGIGAFTKLFPIFLLPPLLVYMHQNGASRKHLLSAVVVGLLGFLGYLAWVLPYGLQYLATYTPVTQLVPFIGGVRDTVNAATFGIVSFYCLLFIFGKKANPLASFLSTFMVYYLLTNPAPQYLLWALPLIAIDLTFANRLKAFAITALYVLAFTQWFLVSSAFLTPSGYSLLMFPLGGNNLPSYSVAIGKFLDSDLVGIIILPVVSSATYASILVYAVEEIHSWFTRDEKK